jgi:outer membrane lipoprotein
VQQDRYVGEHVRWGGVIVETMPRADETCIEVVSLPLDRRARPRLVDDSFGRFRGCVPGFYDPEIYAPEREVTVVGTVQGVERGRVGEQGTTSARRRRSRVPPGPSSRADDVHYGVGVNGIYPGAVLERRLLRAARLRATARADDPRARGGSRRRGVEIPSRRQIGRVSARHEAELDAEPRTPASDSATNARCGAFFV